MNFRKIATAAAALLVLGVAWQHYRWLGVAFVVTLAVMWILLHFSRALQVLKRAADRPIGHVASAVMLNAKLQPGASLLHVIALTKSLGLLQSEKDTQPEVFRWTDTGQSHVTCEFVGGKLSTWALVRPTPDELPGDIPA
jgi:hypothetical protein